MENEALVEQYFDILRAKKQRGNETETEGRWEIKVVDNLTSAIS